MAFADTARLAVQLDLKGNFNTNIRASQKALGDFDRQVGSTGSRAFKLGQQVGTGIRNSAKLIASATLIVGTATAGIVAKAISAASDLNEVVSKVGVVFKDQAKSILAFGKTSAAALGLSESAALSAAATYGNLFVSMGLTSKKSAEMSRKLVILAADLASFNNIDPAEALEKLRAGLTGESEPLKTLGINLNEQTLKAKALELGLVKLSKGQKQYTAVLDPATKAQAAYALIMEQSKTAQGDFGRTSSGLANQLRILKANFTNLLTTLGTPVLPKIAGIVQRINEELKNNQPAVAKVGQSIADLFSDKNIAAGAKLIRTALETAKAAAPVLQQTASATLQIVKTAVGLFTSLPKEIQGLAVGAFAINKLTGGLVTNLAGGLFDVLQKARGASPANPVFVSDISGGLGGAAGAGKGGLSPVTAFLGLLGVAGVEVAVAGMAHDVLKSLGIDLGKGVQAGPIRIGGPTEAQRVRQQNLANVSVSPQTQAAVTRAVTQALTTGLVATNRILTGGGGSATRTKDDRVDLAQLQRSANIVLSEGFARMVRALRESKGTAAIAKAVKDAVETVVTKGRGSVDSTKATLAGLRAALKNTHDPKLQASIRAAIGKVESKLPGREFASKQLSKADALLRDGKLSRGDLKTLQGIERDLKNRGLPHAASVISAKVEAAKRAQVSAQDRVRDAVKRKKLAVTVGGTTVNIPITSYVSGRDVQRTTYRVGNVGTRIFQS